MQDSVNFACGSAWITKVSQTSFWTRIRYSFSETIASIWQPRVGTWKPDLTAHEFHQSQSSWIHRINILVEKLLATHKVTMRQKISWLQFNLGSLRTFVLRTSLTVILRRLNVTVLIYPIVCLKTRNLFPLAILIERFSQTMHCGIYLAFKSLITQVHSGHYLHAEDWFDKQNVAVY